MFGSRNKSRAKCPFRICTKLDRPKPKATAQKRLDGQSGVRVCPLCTAKLKGKGSR